MRGGSQVLVEVRSYPAYSCLNNIGLTRVIYPFKALYCELSYHEFCFLNHRSHYHYPNYRSSQTDQVHHYVLSDY